MRKLFLTIKGIFSPLKSRLLSILFPLFLIATFGISMFIGVSTAWFSMITLFAYLLLGFVIGCFFVSAYSKNLLGHIEQRPKMYGSIREVEAMYTFMLLFVVNIRPLRVFGIKKKLIYSDWFNFVFDMKDVGRHSNKPYEFKNYDEMINMFIKFRKMHDVRLFYKKSDDVVI